MYIVGINKYWHRQIWGPILTDWQFNEQTSEWQRSPWYSRSFWNVTSRTGSLEEANRKRCVLPPPALPIYPRWPSRNGVSWRSWPHLPEQRLTGWSEAHKQELHNRCKLVQWESTKFAKTKKSVVFFFKRRPEIILSTCNLFSFGNATPGKSKMNLFYVVPRAAP